MSAEDLTPEMCCDSSLFLGIKRAASSEALAAVEMKKSKGSVDTADPVAKVSLSDFGFTPETVQSYPSFSVIYSLARKRGLGFMAGIVKNISRLKSQVENIFSVLKLAVVDDGFVGHLGGLIGSLLDDEAFHKAFVGVLIEDQFTYVLALVEAYSMQKSDLERVKYLRRDAGLGFVLQRKTDTDFFMRETLSIILGYWSSPWLCSKLREAVNGNDAARELPRMTRIIKVDVPPSIEGLKEALATRFDGYKHQSMCKVIDRDKNLYKVSVLSFNPTDTMKWFDIYWLGEEEFCIGMSGHYEHPYPGCSPV
ncbi:ABC transporter [Striga asiatica]|uniref:ABC transporter n=1 Tax=Striga asiatica TaxID=4170 RepID=A0A5A7P710_STRAF|nr:ABC transporter [Striga asiatica]